MKKLLTMAAVCGVTATGLIAGVAAPASAEPYLCSTIENAPFYEQLNVTTGGQGYLFTLSGGRGFRALQGYVSDSYGRLWVQGHGAEHPDREGWVELAHTNC